MYLTPLPELFLDGVGGCRRLAIPSSPAQQFTHQCILVIGGSQGIGLSMVDQLTNYDVKLLFTGRDKQRAMSSLENLKLKSLSLNSTVINQRTIQAESLELSDLKSIETFTSVIIPKFFQQQTSSCKNGHKHAFDVVFFQAGMMLATGFNSSFIIKETGQDLLFNANFIGHALLLQRMIRDKTVDLATTKLVFSSSMLHAFGQVNQVMELLHGRGQRYPPWNGVPVGSGIYGLLGLGDFLSLQGYCNSKLAMTSYILELRSLNKFKRDVIAMTPGAVETSILVSTREKNVGGGNHGSSSFLDRLLAGYPIIFSSEQGAFFTLASGLIEEKLRPMEFIYPYFLPPSIFAPGSFWYIIIAGLAEGLEKLTASETSMWGCPASPNTLNKELRLKLKEMFFVRN
jgi:NAD(P)-dependent dehydrogenase (short-subunit alcohol dehydrogenase family)